MNKILQKILPFSGMTDKFIGLDIGRCAVKLAYLAKTQGEPKLMRAECVDLGSNPPSEILKKVLSGVNLQQARLICVLNSPETMTKKINMPFMPRQELEEAIRWQVKHFLSFPLDEAVLDFEILGETFEKGVKKLNVMVAVAPRRVVDQSMALISPLGRISSIIPASLAARHLIKNWSLDSEGAAAVLELGAGISELDIYKNSSLEISRKFPISGEDITQSLVGVLALEGGRVELGLEEAERIKKDFGIPLGSSSEKIEGKMTTTQIFSLIRPKIEQLVTEIERSFDFYREELGGTKVTKLILFGGGAMMKGLVPFLSRELEIEVEIGDALQSIQSLSETIDEKMIIAHRLNLAVGAALSRGRGINLLPAEYKQEMKLFIRKASLKAFAAAVLTVLFLLFTGLNIQKVMYEKKLTAAKIEYSYLGPQIERLQEENVIQGILQKAPYWEEILKEISSLIPQNVYLTELTMSGETLSLKGVITANQEPVEATLSNFMLKLEEGIFKNVNLISTRKTAEGSNTSEFELKCGID